MRSRLRAANVRGCAVAFLVVLGATVLAACKPITGPTGDPPSTPAPDGNAPVSARATVDGIVVNLVLERARTTAGQQLRARVQITNLGPARASYTSGGCGLFNGFDLVSPPLVQPPPGRDFEGSAKLAKFSATAGGVSPAAFLKEDAVFHGATALTCTGDLRVDDIGAGQTETLDITWPGILSDREPAIGGHYSLTYAFPFLGHVPSADFGGDPIKDAKPITATVDFDVDAGPRVAIPSTAAVDAALSDPRVASWLAGVTLESFSGASITLRDGIWRMEIETDYGEATIKIDPTIGVVTNVELP